MPERIFTVAVNLCATQIRAALIDVHGKIYRRFEEPTKASEGPEAILSQIVSLARSAFADTPLELVAGVGLSSAGPLETERGVALDVPALAGFRDVPVQQVLQNRLDLRSSWKMMVSRQPLANGSMGLDAALTTLSILR